MNRYCIFILIFLSLFFRPLTAGICTSGTSSLINIPIASVLSTNNVVMGMSYIDNRVAYLTDGRYDNIPFFIAIGYLPRLEFSAGVVLIPGQKSYDGTNTYKDGVVSLQLLVLKERPFIPAIAVGARDIYSYILLNTSYIVGSKTLVKKKFTKLILHCGYGHDIFKTHIGVLPQDRNNPVGHTIIGMFGGLEMNWRNRISYMMEFDTQKINMGFRVQPFRRMGFELNLLNMSNFSGGIYFQFRL